MPRTPWIVGTVFVALAALLLAGCGDPSDSAEGPPSSATSRQRAAVSGKPSPGEPGGTGESGRKVRPRVLYLGDSLAMENQKVLGELVREQWGARYTSAPYSGTTLCDYLDLPGRNPKSLVPEKDKAARLVRELRPDVVVLQFWGNSWGYTPCMDGLTYDAAKPGAKEEYYARYARDAERLTAQIRGAARAVGSARPAVVWVSQGPDPIAPERIRRVNQIYERQAGRGGDFVADAGKAVSAAGARQTWVRYLPCTSYERAHPDYCTQRDRGRTALHRADDYLHFCLAPTTPDSRPCPVRSPGIMRISQAVSRVVGHAAR